MADGFVSPSSLRKERWGMSVDIFSCLNWGGCYWHLVGGARSAAQHLKCTGHPPAPRQKNIKSVSTGASLAVQWFRASNTGGMDSIPGEGTKIPHVKRPTE